MPLISVIITVYNKQDYVSASIKSVLSQTLQDFELIIVNDYSNDSSLKKIQELKLEKKHRVISNPKNHGVSYSRNIGLDNALGKYIMFLDGDDVISDTELFEHFSHFISDTPIDYVFLIKNYYGKKLKPNISRISVDFQKIANVDDFILKQKFPLGGSASTIFRRDKAIHLKFDNDSSHFEDWEFTYKLIRNCQNVYLYTKEAIYINYISNSLSRAVLQSEVEIPAFYYYLKKTNQKHSKLFLWILITSFTRTHKLTFLGLLKLNKKLSLKISKNIQLSRYFFYSILKLWVNQLT